MSLRHLQSNANLVVPRCRDEGHDPQLKRIWEDQVREMHGFYHGRDAAEVRLKAQGIAADQSIASSADNSTAR